MSDISTQQRMEILRMAKEILNEEYRNRRSEDHNAWMIAYSEACRTRTTVVPYPPTALYPTEEIIVARAVIMNNFVNGSSTDTKDTPTVVTNHENDVPIDHIDEHKPNTLLPGWIRRAKS